MLVKKELASVEPLPFPQVSRGKAVRGKHEFALAVAIMTLPQSGKVFIADMFHWIDKKPVLRFVSDGKNYLCAECPITEWGKFKPDSCFDIYSVDEDPDARSVTVSFLFPKGYPYHSTALGVISEWISRSNAERRYEAENRKDALRRSHFAMYPDYPADLEDYCDTQVFDRWYIFFSKLQKHGKRDGHCTCCGKHFRLPRETKHNQEGVCPRCGAQVTFKSEWNKGVISDTSSICIANNVDDQLLLRWVNVDRSYVFPYSKRTYRFSTYAYNLYLKGGKIYFYKWTCTPYSYGNYWYRGKLGSQGYDSTHIYTNNLREVFGDRYYNVDLQKGLDGKRSVLSFCQLLNNLKNIPATEYIFKAGLPRLASELDKFRYIPDDAKFEDIYGLPRNYIPILRLLDASYNEVKLIKAAGRWVSEETIQKYRALKMEGWRTGELIDAVKDASFERIINYLTKQKELLKKRGPSVFQLWLDYINMSKNLNVDLSHKSIMFPKNIQEAHDQLLPRFDAVRKEVENKQRLERAARKKAQFLDAIRELYQLLPPLPYEKNGFKIVLPQDPADLVREGQSLDHCVGYGGYDDSTIQKRSIIIFVRMVDEPDKPFYTMEYGVRDGRIRQLYGFKNKPAPLDVRQFAEGFVKRIKKYTEIREEKTA